MEGAGAGKGGPAWGTEGRFLCLVWNGMGQWQGPGHAEHGLDEVEFSYN